MMETIIHIEWEGPYSLNQLDTLNDLRRDHGLYQIYGHHPVYGSNVLLYIGQTYGRDVWGADRGTQLRRRLARGPRAHRSLRGWP